MGRAPQGISRDSSRTVRDNQGSCGSMAAFYGELRDDSRLFEIAQGAHALSMVTPGIALVSFGITQEHGLETKRSNTMQGSGDPF